MRRRILSFLWLLLFQSIAAFNTTDIFDDTFDHMWQSTGLLDDTFEINETEPKTELSTNQPYDTLNSTKMSMSEIQPIHPIECNHSVSGFLHSNTTVYIDFKVTNTMDVVITNCPSYHWVNVSDCDRGDDCSRVKLQRAWDWDLNTVMYLKNSKGMDITNQSYNFCDADDCYASEICLFTRAETMVMKDLPPDQYRIELSTVDNSSDPFRVNVSCGDFSNLTSIWDPYHCDDPDASLSDSSDTIIGCDMSISGHLTCGETKTFVFLLFEEDNVVFETCGSDFDTKLYLYNASDTKVGEMIHVVQIQRQSINGCDADDCHWTSVFNLFCDGDEYPKSETIPMMNLPAGVYYLNLFSWSQYVYGEYNLGIHCDVEMPEPFNGTLDHCNYVQLGTLQGELKKLPYPFNESIQDGAVYPIGYCHHIKGIPYSFRFECTASGGIQLRTWENTKLCAFIAYNGVSDIVQNDYMNTSGMNLVSVLLDSD